MKCWTIVVLILPLAVANHAAAQPYYGGWGGGWGGYYHASTAAEGYARGMSDVVRSAGAANLMNSAAAGNYADARSKELDNRLKYTKTYFEQRQMNQMYRAQERGKPLSADQLASIAAADVPKRLSDSQLDPITGEIGWPIILRDKRYAESTEQLDALFRARAEAGNVVDAEQYQQIVQLCDQLQETLGDRVTEYKSWDFLDARKFLRSLAYEPRLPPK